jgi:hypothetical protein
MAINKECSLVIHGPISIYTLLSIYKHREEYPITVVIPRPTNEQSSQKALLRELNLLAADDKFSTNLLVYNPHVPEGTDNKQNRYLHFFSVAAGLQLCNTKYSIKLRSDEFYSDLSPFVEAVQSSGKIVTNDVFFRRPEKYVFHPSDHLVGGTTETLLEAFSLARKYCEMPDELKKIPTVDKKIFADIKKSLAAEQVFGVAAIVTAQGLNSLELDDSLAMRNTFHIVPSDELGFFRIAYNSGKTPMEYFTTEYYNQETDINNIDQCK